MIVPGGGFSPDRNSWISCRPNFLLAVPVLSPLFRRLFLQKLVVAHTAGDLRFFGKQAKLAYAKAFRFDKSARDLALRMSVRACS